MESEAPCPFGMLLDCQGIQVFPEVLLAAPGRFRACEQRSGHGTDSGDGGVATPSPVRGDPDPRLLLLFASHARTGRLPSAPVFVWKKMLQAKPSVK